MPTGKFWTPFGAVIGERVSSEYSIQCRAAGYVHSSPIWQDQRGSVGELSILNFGRAARCTIDEFLLPTR
jgi:hypothetical protein